MRTYHDMRPDTFGVTVVAEDVVTVNDAGDRGEDARREDTRQEDTPSGRKLDPPEEPDGDEDEDGIGREVRYARISLREVQGVARDDTYWSTPEQRQSNPTRIGRPGRASKCCWSHKCRV